MESVSERFRQSMLRGIEYKAARGDTLLDWQQEALDAHVRDQERLKVPASAEVLEAEQAALQARVKLEAAFREAREAEGQCCVDQRSRAALRGVTVSTEVKHKAQGFFSWLWGQDHKRTLPSGSVEKIQKFFNWLCYALSELGKAIDRAQAWIDERPMVAGYIASCIK